MSRQELRLAGSGGQGVILATVVLAEAALLSGKHTAQSQAYGPEARGGSCKAETLISDTPIGFTKVQNPTFLMVLTQRSFNHYGPETDENCLILMDSALTVPEGTPAKRIVSLPILDTAKNAVGRIQTANIVAVGCINGLLNITDDAVMEKAVKMHIPKGTEELNMKALAAGRKLAETWLKENKA